MGDARRSLRGWWRARRPSGVPGAVATVFVVGGLLAGGAGAALDAGTPPAWREAPIVDPIAAPEQAPLASAPTLEPVEAAAATTVSSSWTPPAPRRGSGGGGGGSAVLTHTNAARAAHGLAGLSWNSTLASRSCAWASQLATTDSGLSHSSYPGGFRAWGENIASGQGSASAAVTAWMNSTTGHRENILNPTFTMMGSCSATGASGTPYWVQQFGG